MEQQALTAAFIQLVANALVVERQVHGITSLGVGELEIQLRRGRQAGAGAAQGDARRGEVAQVQPGVLWIDR
jgi:hypothetical protein